MKIIHIADLHIGKVVNGFSMINDQAFVLKNIVDIMKEKEVDVLIIAGDVYDKRNPSDESVNLFNEFINDISKLDITTFIVSGNHDSSAKLTFANDLLKKHHIHIVGKVKDKIECITLDDEYGKVHFHLLPFIRPGDVRHLDEKIKTYHEAIECAIKHSNIDYSERNIFVGHQFFASGTEEISDSEVISVGGSDNVGYNLLLDFDYAALGHLHRPQKLKSEYIRYSGSILTYSESEVRDNKSLVYFEIKQKNDLKFELIPLISEKAFIKKEGYLEDILKEENSDDYIFVTLFDDVVSDALGKLRSKFKNLMSLNFNNKRTSSNNELIINEDVENSDPIELFKSFYKLQNNDDLNRKQLEIVEYVIERIDKNASN